LAPPVPEELLDPEALELELEDEESLEDADALASALLDSAELEDAEAPVDAAALLDSAELEDPETLVEAPPPLEDSEVLVVPELLEDSEVLVAPELLDSAVLEEAEAPDDAMELLDSAEAEVLEDAAVLDVVLAPAAPPAAREVVVASASPPTPTEGPPLLQPAAARVAKNNEIGRRAMKRCVMPRSYMNYAPRDKRYSSIHNTHVVQKGRIGQWAYRVRKRPIEGRQDPQRRGLILSKTRAGKRNDIGTVVPDRNTAPLAVVNLAQAPTPIDVTRFLPNPIVFFSKHMKD
jgi:hypothetical protein